LSTMRYDEAERLSEYIQKFENETVFTQKNEYNGDGQRISKIETQNEIALIELKELTNGSDDEEIENPGGGEEELIITPGEDGNSEDSNSIPGVEESKPSLSPVTVSATREKEYFYQDGIVLYNLDSVSKKINEGELNSYSSNGEKLYDINAMNSALTSYSDALSTFNIMGDAGNIIASEKKNEENAAEGIFGLGVDNNKKSYYFYNKDIRGSTTNILAEDNKVRGEYTAVESYKYDVFGETEIFDNTNKESEIQNIENEICYAGGVYDKTTKLYYLNARYYDPADARFISQDTYRGENNDYGSWNLYTYCANDPVNYTDPSGHWGIKNIFKKAVSKVKTAA
ncbi:MAG: RHS repeat-associated core domain-containing protein, partial [Anaerovoracaceae bacterium]